MLALDIETTGLKANIIQHTLTMVCLYDPDMGLKKSFRFVECICPHTGFIHNQERFAAMRDEIITLLNTAKNIAAYNGVAFDLPFIATKFLVTDDLLGSWIKKTIDVFSCIQLLTDKYFKLQLILQENSLSSKNADGLTAIAWAKSGSQEDIAALEHYCMQDTVLTHALTCMDTVVLPWRSRNLVWSKENKLVC